MRLVAILLTALTAAALAVDYARQQAKIPSSVERLPPPPPLPPSAAGKPAPAAPPAPGADLQRREDLKDSRPAPLDDSVRRASDPPAVAVGEGAQPALLNSPTAAAAIGNPEPLQAPSSPGKGSLGFLRGGGGVRPLARLEEPFGALGEAAPPISESGAGAPELTLSACGGPREFAITILRTQRTWSALVQEMGLEHPPAIDFRRQMAVVLYGGKQPRGTKFAIVSASEDGGRFLVRYRKAQATPEEIANADARHRPWRPVEIAVVRRSSLSASYREQR